MSAVNLELAQKVAAAVDGILERLSDPDPQPFADVTRAAQALMDVLVEASRAGTTQQDLATWAAMSNSVQTLRDHALARRQLKHLMTTGQGGSILGGRVQVVKAKTTEIKKRKRKRNGRL